MSTSVTTTCRDIDELLPVAQKAIRLFFQECYKAGIAIFVTETYRSQGRQDYLYAQGRTRPGNIVTWTRNSNHKSRLAWDIGAATLNGNTNIYNSTVIKKAGAIAIKLGITWGGTWVNNLDYPHFEVKSSWKIPKGYSLEGKISIPTRSNQSIKVVDSLNKLPQVERNVDDSTLEEDLSMANYIPTIKDTTSPTLKTSIINKLKEAYEKGQLSSDKWYKAAEDGTLSIVDLVLLLNHIDRAPVIADMTSSAIRASAVSKITELTKSGDLGDTRWQESAEAGTLSIADTVGLLIHTDK